jgi:hypothetical protein
LGVNFSLLEKLLFSAFTIGQKWSCPALHEHNFSTSEENNIANVWPMNNNYIGFFSFSTSAKKLKIKLSFIYYDPGILFSLTKNIS